jgi:DNA ligase-1
MIFDVREILKKSENIESFSVFCEIAQLIAETRKTSEKIDFFTEYLKILPTDRSLDLVCQFMGEGAFPMVSGDRTSIGHSTIAQCACDYLEIDYDRVFKPSRVATGSASEVISKLMNHTSIGMSKRTPKALRLDEISDRFEALKNSRKRDSKFTILQQTWSEMTPLEIKYFLRIMGVGSLRIGFEARSILNAISLAYDADIERLRYAHMVTGSLGKTAVLARNKELKDAEFELFRPVAFMLAAPYDEQADSDLTEYHAEEKFDGMRCQLHVKDGHVELYSRDLNQISAAFPELVELFSDKSKLGMPDVLLDGEICVFTNNTIQPFQWLQKRMGVKTPSQKLLKDYPVVFVAFDLLFKGGNTLFKFPLKERLSMLDELSTKYDFRRVTRHEVHNTADVNRLFKAAISHGNEGLILKKSTSNYEFGQRKRTWLKVKQPGGSLDTVILYAHAGTGKRGGTYSDFTLGIRVEDTETFGQDFIPIGKAYGGYTDEELRRINSEIRTLVLEKFGPTLMLKPKIVVEIEFDEIQVNKRTKAGFTLRFPRFRAIRWDKPAHEADTLAEVERLYVLKSKRNRVTQELDPSFI